MASDGKKTISTQRNPIAKAPVGAVSSVKPHGKAVASTALPRKSSAILAAASANGLNADGVSAASTLPSKRPGKAHVSPASDTEILLFREVSLGPHEANLRFRLLHFWEARNPRTKLLIGEELLLIDEEGHVIQGFIPAGRVDTFVPPLVAGSVYQLSNFFGSRSKAVYRVASHSVTVSFSWNSRLSILENCLVQFSDEFFRFHKHEDFQANCDQKGDLYDFLGHLKLVNGKAVTEDLSLDEVAIPETRQLLLHVQSHDGPVLKLYLWDDAAKIFCKKFKSHGSTPRVVLVTTVNPKQLGGTLTLSSMSSTRVFIDDDVEATREYLTWFSSNQDIANKIKAEVVTKPETVTIEDLLSYTKEAGAKVAWFECIATIDDVLQGSSWYYISCGGCNTKATKGPTSLICNNPKCKKDQAIGVPQYLTRISVYDNSEQAAFVILGDAGRELTGKHASELVSSYIEANEGKRGELPIPVPQALIDCIGNTYRFVVKVSDHNLSGKTQSFTVTRVLPPESQHPTDQTEEAGAAGRSASFEDGGSTNCKIRVASEHIEPDDAKRPRNG